MPVYQHPFIQLKLISREVSRRNITLHLPSHCTKLFDSLSSFGQHIIFFFIRKYLKATLFSENSVIHAEKLGWLGFFVFVFVL